MGSVVERRQSAPCFPLTYIRSTDASAIRVFRIRVSGYLVRGRLPIFLLLRLCFKEPQPSARIWFKAGPGLAVMLSPHRRMSALSCSHLCTLTCLSGA